MGVVVRRYIYIYRFPHTTYPYTPLVYICSCIYLLFSIQYNAYIFLCLGIAGELYCRRMYEALEDNQR